MDLDGFTMEHTSNGILLVSWSFILSPVKLTVVQHRISKDGQAQAPQGTQPLGLL